MRSVMPISKTAFSSGRSPDGTSGFRPLSAPTAGTNNQTPLISDLVINEIMYSPISLNPEDQYVELYNRSGSTVNLSGWKFVSGISFTFPNDAVVPPGGYFVVARNASRMLTNYPNLNANNLVGNFGGSLSGKGERLALARPDAFVSTNLLGIATTTVIYPVVNELTYGTGGRWPVNGRTAVAAVSNSSIPGRIMAGSRIGPTATRPAKAPWTDAFSNGTIDNGSSHPRSIAGLVEGPASV